MDASVQKGFTITELVVVIVILAILGAIAVPKFWNAKLSAENASCLVNMHSIEAAVAHYMIYSLESSNTPATPASLDELVTQNFLSYVPDCPMDETAYTYDSNTGTVTCTNHTR